MLGVEGRHLEFRLDVQKLDLMVNSNVQAWYISRNCKNMADCVPRRAEFGGFLQFSEENHEGLTVLARKKGRGWIQTPS